MQLGNYASAFRRENRSNRRGLRLRNVKDFERFLEDSMNNRFKSDLSGTMTLQIELNRRDVVLIIERAANLFRYRVTV